MTRVMRPPTRLRVIAGDDGVPTAIEVAGRMMPIEIVERWRVSERWWPQPIDREYAKVIGPGWLLLIFRDLIGGGWFMERVFD
jgi:hypothetical protein